MTQIYEELALRIRGESLDLDRLVSKAVRVWAEIANLSEGKDIYLDSVAFNLHGFYSRLESMFEAVGKYLDRNVPSGEVWHRELLRQMSNDVPGVRPAVISADSVGALDELRRFRHLVRNIYSFNLVPEKMAPLISSISALWPELNKELSAFADYLHELSQAAPN